MSTIIGRKHEQEELERLASYASSWFVERLQGFTTLRMNLRLSFYSNAGRKYPLA